MLIGIADTNAEKDLLALIQDANTSRTPGGCGLVSIDRNLLRNVSNSKIILTLKPALQDASQPKIFFLDNNYIFVSWFGMLKQTYDKLKSITCNSLLKENISGTPEEIVVYMDPLVVGDELSLTLKKNLEDKKRGVDMDNKAIDYEMRGDNSPLKATPAQLALYHEEHTKKPNRRPLRVLIVEDEPFLRRLLQQALTSGCTFETASSAEDGWQFYLQKDPDIVFVDINLLKTDGHTLAHHIRKLDPTAYIIMVTASRDMADIEKAKENRVDGFIVKPYNKKKIDECIRQYVHKYKPHLSKSLGDIGV